MQLEKDQTALDTESADETQERDTEWLLDRDLAEPEEGLFAFENDHVEVALTPYEAEIAARPMFRGHGEGDDLSSMVDEEIVMSEVGSENDIYTTASDLKKASVKVEAPLTVNHLALSSDADLTMEVSVADGTDILFLADEDDIGEHLLVLVKDEIEAEVSPDVSVEAATEPTIELALEPILEPETESESPFDIDQELDLGSGLDDDIELDLGDEFLLEPEPELDREPELELEQAIEFEAELNLEPQSDHDSGIENEGGSAKNESFELGSSSDFEIGSELNLEIDQALDESLDVVFELEEEQCLESDLEIDFELDVESGLESGAEQGFLLEPDSGESFLASIDVPLEAEPAPQLSVDTEAERDAKEYLEAEGQLESDAQKEPELESVLEYIANTPAPTDELAFDEYLLQGQQLESTEKEIDSNSLTVVHTEGIASVDPGADNSIDYHEDFRMIDGFEENTVSAITGVIAQVMEEVTAAVKARLDELDIDSELVQVEAMLGNDVESIIECVTDGYAPIVNVRPELPAALRQLGQSEVDAMYIRISHADIPGNWNCLFQDDFVLPELEGVVEASETGEETSPQPFAAFDLDEFDFDEPTSTQDNSFDEELTSFAELSSDDPLASIDFATLADDEINEEFTPEFLSSEVEAHSADDAKVLGDISSASEPSSEAYEVTWCVPEGLRFSTADSGGSALFEEFLGVFMEEAASELERLEDAIGGWEAESTSDTTVVPAAVSHTLHTLKGIAKGVGLHRYGTLVHNYETLLDGLSCGAGDGARVGYFKIVNTWLDSLVQGFEVIEESKRDIVNVLPGSPGDTGDVSKGADNSVDTEHSILEPKQGLDVNEGLTRTTVELTPAKEISQASKLTNAPVAKPAVVTQTDRQLADEGAKALAAQQTIRMTSEALDNLSNLTNQAQQLGVRSSESAVRSKLAAAESLARLSSVRAHIVKIADRALSNVTAKDKRKRSELDALEMDQYSELQEAANILRESVEDLDDLIRLSSRQISTAEALMKQQSSVISTLGSSIQAVRVIPVSRLFPGLRRIVRNVGTDLGKTVSFKVLKQVGTLDRDNHARCQVILEHMVRNAMDHGIESPEQRTADGKPASGTISIDVNKKGADYIITLSDDGRGVDPALMRETAYQRGLDIDVDALSDDEAVRLIFHKGFSTASTVSEISGRGVGMDIVLSELQKIGGDVEIETEVGRGTSFHIRIPPNVSVNGALLVSAGERSYAIPLDGLVAVENVSVDKFFDAVAGNSKLTLAGVDCDPAYLATLCHGASLPDRTAWTKSVPVLIAGSHERYMAIAVDDVKQALELVIRSLGVQFSSIAGVAGATTTADGQAVVALDLNALVQGVGSADISSMTPVEEQAEELLVLVVDDSRTQRMVSTSQFDTLGVETVTAENGMVAIDLLNTTTRLPDVILLDVEMPVKDGIQTLREIRKSTRYSHIPVIMVTSRTGTKHRALADEAGCDGYMGKPFNFPVLVEQISQLTGHKLEVS